MHGRSKALKGVVVCSNKRARQPFGNDRLLSLLGFGNVMFDSVGCVQQPRWGRLVRWRLATTFPPVRLLARGPATVAVGSMVAGNSHRAAAPGQPGHADPVSSTCDGRRGSAGSSRSLRCLWLTEHLSRRLIFNLDMGLDMKRALSGNGERLSTQIRALARQ